MFRYITLSIAMILAGGLTSLQAQSFKVAIELPDHNPGLQLQTREVMAIPGTNNYILTGDVKGNAPDYENHAFLIRTDRNGEPVFSKSLSNLTATSTNGIRGASIAMDTEGNYYLGGATVQNFAGVGRGSEKTITSVDGSGIMRWSIMANNWSYEDIDFNIPQQQLYTFSGPDDGIYPADLLISRHGTNGRLIDGLGIQNGVENEASTLVYDEDQAYYLVATAAADLAPMIYIARVDTGLSMSWGAFYDEAGYQFEVADAAWHDAGYLLVTGTATELGNQKKRGFLLAVNPDGSEKYFKLYSLNEYEFLTLSGVDAVSIFRDSVMNGAILAGTTQDSGAVSSSNVMIAVDTIGNIRWTQGYSYFPPSDVEYADGFSDVVALENSAEFVAVGQYATYVYGSTLIERRVTMVKAPILDGFIDDNGHCLNDLSANSANLSAAITPVGSSAAAGTNNIFSYQLNDLGTGLTWCTLEYTGGNGITPPGSGGGERIHPFADQFDKFQLGAVQNNNAVFSISISNPGRLTTLTYEVMDLHGRIIREAAIAPNEDLITVKADRWAAGLYYLRVLHQGQTIASKKLIPGPFTQ